MIIEFWKTNENSITCYKSRKNTPEKIREIIRVPLRRQKNNKQSVTVVSPNGEKKEYESVAKAAEAVGLEKHTLYDFFGGRAKNKTEYQIYKSA